MQNVTQLPKLTTIPEEEQREFISSAIQSTLTQMQSSVADFHDLLLDQDGLTIDQLIGLLEQTAYAPFSVYRNTVNFAKVNGIQYPTPGYTVSS